ncbi:glycosyl hydrolase family 8 [Kitasatospora sp. NBC_01287]|uniref:glycosyl hydrolase family 8 n=1 Tax=Kitasatospora sp. NBC_01287 TaxID=2903573 RepID=UPI00224CF95E|nr:glycosyl hydrolase family 8 [Kitasatospora sp. NBC_01287]MCX4745639.1 glycosyl hydrolase family 8 [Kitasatospora sp. NBC_01287]
MRNRWKRPLASVVTGCLLGLSVTALATAPAQAAPARAATTIPATTTPAATAPAHPFPTHTTYQVGVMPSAPQATRDAAVEKEYDSWKATYLVHGCASNEYYVSTKGDGDATNNGPVSEGQGYGMNIVPLMAGYDASAQSEFNGLWQLVKDHEDQYGLMQWQLDGKTCKYYSGGTPDGATDGDLDIGYGLILADKQWGGYTADAKAWLAAFYAHDVAPDGHLKCEDDGPNTDTRPSDQMLDHLRAFGAYDTAHDWTKVIQRTEALDTEYTAAYSASAGLLSDFVVNADTTSPKPAPANYQEDQPDNIVGYNSIRVPWHLGTDALLNGASAAATEYGLAKKESACLKGLSGGNPQKVYPHVNLNCTAYSTSDQAEEAGDAVGPAAMASGDQAWTDTVWNYLATNPFGDGYYGETIKTLVYLVMAGDYWSPASGTAPANDFSLSASPGAGSVAPGGTASTTVATAVSAGSAQSVALAAAGLPTGATASFSPASVTAGNSAALTLATGTGTPAGSYPITITGTAASGSHTATYTLTVSGTGGGCTAAQLLGDQGFEKGATIAPWTETSTTGSAPINNDTADEPAHAGSWDAWLNGDGKADTDTVGQSVAIPAGCTATLSYWLHIDTTESTSSAKPDTLTVQLLNSAGTVLTTVAGYSNLDKNSGYTQHTVDVSAYAGQSVTLRFTGTETDANGGTTSFVLDDTALNTTG